MRFDSLVPSLPSIIGALVAAILILGAALALTLRLRRLEDRIARAMARLDNGHDDRHRHAGKQQSRLPEPDRTNRELQGQLESLRSMIGKIPGDTALQVQAILPQRPSEPPNIPPPSPRTWADDEPREPEDGVAQLLTIANHIVQQSSTTLEAFRTSAGALSTRVAAWPRSADGMPVAFIVEYRGAHYAVPNVVKPARLPKEWFNRADFGVNDEIQRVRSLPRLRRTGDDFYDVQEPGVFDK